MKTHLIASSRRMADKRLSKRSSETYLELLAQLCGQYRHYEAVSVLEAHLAQKDYEAVLKWADSIPKQKYGSVDSHYVHYQFAHLIKKYPWDPKVVNTDPEGTAWRKFLSSEHSCKRVNERFRARRQNHRYANEQELNKMRSFIQYVLGIDCPIESILEMGDFGPGASIGVHGDATSAARKLMAAKYTVTPASYYYGQRACLYNYHFAQIVFPGRMIVGTENVPDRYYLDYTSIGTTWKKRTDLVRHNKIVFVPKTAMTHRSIAVEPLINSYIQKGADVYMRQRLKRIGIDLEDQSLNQRMAREGSLVDDEESFVTIDLSAASDSLATEVVQELLPTSWFEFLDALRSKDYEYQKVHRTFNKFCSMGNGFCFPLETLIFASVCSAVGAGNAGKDYSVYGDDIIVRKKYATEVIRLLRYLGFKTNVTKTFVEGPFRESCGADWYAGVDVRPYTLDEKLDSVESLFKLLNLTRRSPLVESFFSGVRDFVVHLIPPMCRLYRPYKRGENTGIDSLGDEHLYSPACFFDKKRRVWVVYELESKAVPDTYWETVKERFQLALYGLLRGSTSECLFAFRRKKRYRVVRKDNVESSSTWTPPTYPLCEGIAGRISSAGPYWAR